MAPGKISTLSCPTCPWYACTLDMPSARNVLAARGARLPAPRVTGPFSFLCISQEPYHCADDCRKLIPRSVLPHARQQSSPKKSFSQNHSMTTTVYPCGIQEPYHSFLRLSLKTCATFWYPTFEQPVGKHFSQLSSKRNSLPQTGRGDISRRNFSGRERDNP